MPMNLQYSMIPKNIVSLYSIIYLKLLTISKKKFSERPTSVAFIGPSVTPYENFNPAYRLYYIDGEHKNSTFVSIFLLTKTA